MKWNFLGALMLSVALASQGYGFCLLDRMLGSGCGCCCEPVYNCCEKSCCAEPSCCVADDYACGCAANCCDPCSSCCSGGGCSILENLFGSFRGCGSACGGFGGGCCEATCCAEPTCCAADPCGCASACHCGRGGCGLLDGLTNIFRGRNRGCCEPTCCAVEASCCVEPTCGCPSNACCNRGGCGILSGGRGLLDNLCGMFRRGGGCCHNHCYEASCCVEPTCGCASFGGYNGACGCGNGGSHDVQEAAPAEPVEASALMPIPPMPMADPNASVGRGRDVVRTSFVR